MLRAGRAVLQKKEEIIQCEHIWTMHYKSHITQAKTHPPSLESHVITTMEPHFKKSLLHRGRQVCPRCTCLAYNSIVFPTPARRTMQMICIEEDASPASTKHPHTSSFPPCADARALTSPPTQITRYETVSPIKISNGVFADESTIIMAMSMEVHGGSPRAMHKSNACVGQMGGVVVAQKCLYIAPTAPFWRSVRKLQSPCESLEMP